MVFEILAKLLAFLQANSIIIALVASATQWVKLQVQNFPWIKSWMFTVLAFAFAFLFVIPASGFVFSWMWVLEGIAVGGVATGLFKVGSDLMKS
jgi:hypothetical protein